MQRVKKTTRRRWIVAVIMFLIIAALSALYIHNHKDDWISRADALHAAVRDAGTKEGLVYDVDITYGTTDDNLPVFEVLFKDHTAQYRYVIDAQSGEVLFRSKTETS